MIVCIVVFTQSRKLSSIPLRNLSFFACHACKSIYFQPRKHQSCNDWRIFCHGCTFSRASHLLHNFPRSVPVASCARDLFMFFRSSHSHSRSSHFPALDSGYLFSHLWRLLQFFPRLTIHLTTVARMYSRARHHLLFFPRLKPVCVAIASALYLCLEWLTKCDWFVSFSVNCNIFQICYGLTETSPVTNQTQMDDPVDLRVSTVGRVHPNTEVRISRTQKSNK